MSTHLYGYLLGDEFSNSSSSLRKGKKFISVVPSKEIKITIKLAV